MKWTFIPKVSLGPIKFYDRSIDIHRLLGPPSKIDVGKNQNVPSFNDVYNDIGLRLMYMGTLTDNKLVCIVVFPGDITIIDEKGNKLFPSKLYDSIVYMSFDETRIGKDYPYQVQKISHKNAVATALDTSTGEYSLFSAHLAIK